MRLLRGIISIIGSVALSTLALVGLVLLFHSPAEAQQASQCAPSTAQSQAVLRSPLDGEAVNGSVQVRGVATATNFLRYEIAIGPEVTQTVSYQSLGQSTNPVADGPLATWNTTAVRAAGSRLYPDGNYAIRLRVFFKNKDKEACVENVHSGIRIANQQSGVGASGTISATGALSTTTKSNESASVPKLDFAPLLSASRQSFCAGAYLAILAFVALAVYGLIRSLLGWLFRLIFPANQRR
jgi:hypothetical protein